MATDISTINFKDNDLDELEALDIDNLNKCILDLTLSEKSRIEAVNLYFKKEGGDNLIDIINKLIMMYQLSSTKTLKQYLYAISKDSCIDPFLKIISAVGLCQHDEKDDLGYKAITAVYPELKTTGTPYKISVIKLLMRNPNYNEISLSYFCDIINDTELDCDYRYKTILSLEDIGENKNYFIANSCLSFIKNEKNLIEYRILAGQNLLQKEPNDEVISILLNFATSKEVEYNTRADATDVLLQFGTPEVKKTAQSIILELGVGNTRNTKTTIYNNKQNVHTKDIENSVGEILEFLHTFNIMKIKNKPITFEYVEKKIISLSKTKLKENLTKIKIALNRIDIDRAIYSKYSCTLSNILLRIWTYLTGHEHEEEMKTRLIEELVEMAGTCSTGYVSRLANTISGYSDVGIRISWKDQITSNLTGRLNARIRDLDNLTLQEKILSEMTVENTGYENRKNFLKFLRQTVSDIRTEMYEEFKHHMDDCDFDLYFRSALSIYEVGDFV